ncbi:helix-turn-helix domain-containing protein [Aeromicrobium sp. Leaf350]|uniref:winged helix-turn-helix transcriptional regulator n=1 Tax=Aeromicrobium sp. Leaf350 TaxID=2876565 RepID=UPI001E5F0585|nr:helix-turn-helix domain-containing protein [Aeromicrobium sp. Leaf350]
MPLRSDWSEELCPVRRGLDVLGDPWIMLIMRDVLHGMTRFEQIRDSSGISDAVLARRLRLLVDEGLLRKVDYRGDRRTHAEYVATEAGADLLPIMHAVSMWAEKHTALPEGGGHMAIVHESCGSETTSADTCSACGEPLRPDAVSWDKPWKHTRERLVGATDLPA